MSRGGQTSNVGKSSSLNDQEPKKTIIGGVPVPWNEDPDILESAPAADFPHPEKTPRPNPPRRNEKIQVAHYRKLRDRIRDGPLYTVLGRGVRVGKPQPPIAATFDPFEGQPTYSSQRFQKHRRRIPQLHTRPYVMEFFPVELHSALDPNRKRKDEDHAIQPSKKLGISMAPKLSRLEQFEEEAEVHAAGRQDELDNEERDGLADEDEDEAEERDDELDNELQDEDYEDAEADDYEANYFDNGEEEDFGDDGPMEDFGADEDF